MRCVSSSSAGPSPPQHPWLTVSMLVKAQEDVAGGQKRDVEEEEDPYNQENVEQVSSSSGVGVLPPRLCS